MREEWKRSEGAAAPNTSRGGGCPRQAAPELLPRGGTRLPTCLHSSLQPCFHHSLLFRPAPSIHPSSLPAAVPAALSRAAGLHFPLPPILALLACAHLSPLRAARHGDDFGGGAPCHSFPFGTSRKNRFSSVNLMVHKQTKPIRHAEGKRKTGE